MPRTILLAVTATTSLTLVGCGGGVDSQVTSDRSVPATPQPEDCADDSLADELALYCAGVIDGQMSCRRPEEARSWASCTGSWTGVPCG
jgi:hypothetical protein